MNHNTRLGELIKVFPKNQYISSMTESAKKLIADSTKNCIDPVSAIYNILKAVVKTADKHEGDGQAFCLTDEVVEDIIKQCAGENGQETTRIIGFAAENI